jgi:uncharacterized protein
MGGILKGVAVGLVGGAAGFVALAVLIPPFDRTPETPDHPALAETTQAPRPTPPLEPALTDVTPTSGTRAAASEGAPSRPDLPGNAGQGVIYTPPAGVAAVDAPAAEPVPQGPPGVGNRPAGSGAPASVSGPVPGRTVAAAVSPEPVPSPPPAAPPAGSPPAVVTGRLPQVDPAGTAVEAPAVVGPEPRAAAPVVSARLPQIVRADLPGAVPAPAPTAPRGAGDAGILTGRLPQIAVAAPAVTIPEPPDRAEEVLPAWQRHRAAAPTDDRPPLAVVLADPGDPALVAELAEFPFVLTLVLDPFDPTAPARAEVLRAAGHEVALRLDGIAAGVTAGDIEVILQEWERLFPQALALVEPPPGDSRRARALAPVLIPAMAARGLALIAPDRGLSPLLNAARAEGLMSVGLYRALDAGDEDASAIRRLLDRAAFEAERTGRVAVWGAGARAETRAALAGWPGSGRSGRVSPGAAGAALALP